MKPAAAILFLSFAAALAACGDRQEEAETPASEPVAEAPQADTTTPPSIAEAPPAEPLPPPATLPETPSAAPPPATPASPPTAATPAPAAPTTTAPSLTTRPESTVAAQTPKTEASPPPAPAPSGATPPAAPSQDLAHGEQIYRKACAFCHDRGTAGAPKVGDAEAWAPRIAQGVEVLYTNSIKGIRAMPPKGGNPTLSEADVKAAVDYLVAKAR